MNRFSRVIGTGGYLPAKVLTNDEIARTVDTSDAWIVERTGIRERRVAAESETASSMAETAARAALDMAALDPQKVDLIVLATSSPDRVFPSTACLVQQRLGIRRGAAFDVQAACSGFIFALSIADQYIRAGNAKRALVIGSEINSRIIDWKDRSTCVIFGDGAGAVLLESSDYPGVLSTHIHSDGQYQDLLYLPNSGRGCTESEPCFLQMQGNEVFKVAVNTLGRIVDETLAQNHLKKSDIDWLVPHQANIRIIAATAKKLRMSMDHVVVTIEKQGNTSSASVPLALDEAIRDGRIQPGHRVLLEAFGGGFAWGSALFRY